MEIESIREKLERAADMEHSNKLMCVRAARPSGRARCGVGAVCLAMKYQSLHGRLLMLLIERFWRTEIER